MAALRAIVHPVDIKPCTLHRRLAQELDASPKKGRYSNPAAIKVTKAPTVAVFVAAVGRGFPSLSEREAARRYLNASAKPPAATTDCERETARRYTNCTTLQRPLRAKAPSLQFSSVKTLSEASAASTDGSFNPRSYGLLSWSDVQATNPMRIERVDILYVQF